MTESIEEPEGYDPHQGLVVGGLNFGVCQRICRVRHFTSRISTIVWGLDFLYNRGRGPEYDRHEGNVPLATIG